METFDALTAAPSGTFSVGITFCPSSAFPASVSSAAVASCWIFCHPKLSSRYPFSRMVFPRRLEFCHFGYLVGLTLFCQVSCTLRITCPTSSPVLFPGKKGETIPAVSKAEHTITTAFFLISFLYPPVYCVISLQLPALLSVFSFYLIHGVFARHVISFFDFFHFQPFS